MGLTCLVGSCVIETRGLRTGPCRWGWWGGGWRGGEGSGNMLREVAGMAATSAKGLASEELWCEPLLPGPWASSAGDWRRPMWIARTCGGVSAAGPRVTLRASSRSSSGLPRKPHTALLSALLVFPLTQPPPLPNNPVWLALSQPLHPPPASLCHSN